MGVAADRRATSTTAGAGWLSTVEIKTRLAAMFADDNAEALRPRRRPRRSRANCALPHRDPRLAPTPGLPEEDLSREPQCRPAVTCPRRRNRWYRRRPGRVAPFRRAAPRPRRGCGVPRRRLISLSSDQSFPPPHRNRPPDPPSLDTEGAIFMGATPRGGRRRLARKNRDHRTATHTGPPENPTQPKSNELHGVVVGLGAQHTFVGRPPTGPP